jgi:hypothetical protein
VGSYSLRRGMVSKSWPHGGSAIVMRSLIVKGMLGMSNTTIYKAGHCECACACDRVTKVSVTASYLPSLLKRSLLLIRL